jgi:methionyl-tRNA formyltransferase
MNNLIVTLKSWNVENANELKERDKVNNWEIITDRKYFTAEKVKEIDPKYIFVPHWSWKIPGEIVNNYETVIFHPTDLPYGRGGTPIQNLITRGIYDTKISAIRANEEMDAGAIYMKVPVNISEGNVDDILKSMSSIYFNKMIPDIINTQPIPTPQDGKIVNFKRRKPYESNIKPLLETNPSDRQIYDFVRMLDGEGYPKAYIEIGENRFELHNAKIKESKLEMGVRKI